MEYDVVIIGTGPAGFTAAIYAARREMKTLLVGREMGGQVQWASEIENYPGFKNISNTEFISRLQEQVARLGVAIRTDEIKEIARDGETFVLHTSRDSVRARTVIVAMGLSPRRLAIPGEREFQGRGVSYCANCDGPLYRNKSVAVIGGGNAALDAAEVLSKIGREVHLIHRSPDFRAFEALVAEVKARPNIHCYLQTQLKEIRGEGRVTGVVAAGPEGESLIAVDGVFVEIGRIAATDLVATLADRNERQEIVVDEKCRTRTAGFFAAGDVTNSPYKQITVACGQGTIAALAAYEYLQLKANKDAFNTSDHSRTPART